MKDKIDLTDHEERYDESEVCLGCGGVENVLVDSCPFYDDLAIFDRVCSCCEECRDMCASTLYKI